MQITEKDAEALAFLTDVRCEELDTEEEKGFRLTFDFKENPFFSNTCVSPLTPRRPPRGAPLGRPPLRPLAHISPLSLSAAAR